jgi:hypothetical protein
LACARLGNGAHRYYGNSLNEYAMIRCIENGIFFISYFVKSNFMVLYLLGKIKRFYIKQFIKVMLMSREF